MALPEPSYPTTARHELSNACKTQESKLKNNFMKRVVALKEEIKNI